jgi:hypothetical protein
MIASTSFSNSSSNGQKQLPPRFARTPEELIFYTDTEQADYPLFLMPNFEVKIKRRPDCQRFAVFHVKSADVSEYYDEVHQVSYWLYRSFNVDKVKKFSSLEEYASAYPQLPLPPLFEAAKSLKASVAVRTLSLKYEVYKGDYEDLVAEAPATAVVVAVCPPYSSSHSQDQMFAITYSTQKRLIAKLSELSAKSYVSKVTGRRSVFPFVKVKFCLPSRELVLAFEEVKAYLAGAAPAAAGQSLDQAIQELEKLVEQKERELAELRAKLEQLKRLKSVPGRVASLEPLLEVKP